MSRSPAIPFVTSLMLLTATHANAAGWRYVWEKNPQAAYYEGVVVQDGVATRFRTRSTWLLFSSAADIKLHAYDDDERIIGPVPVKNSGFVADAETPEALPPPLLPAPGGDETSPPIFEHPIAPPPSASTADDDEDALNDGDDADDAEGDMVVEPSPSDDPSPDADADIRRRMNGYVTVQLGIGKEWLKATGGVSSYDGNANVGGTIVSGAAQSPDSPWSYPASVAAHNFSTKVSEAQDGTTTESNAKFLRLTVRTGAAYDPFFDAGDPATPAGHGMTVGFGVAYLRLPLLDVDSDLLGTGNLENTAAFGPYIGGGYTRYFDADNLAGIDLLVLPVSLAADVKALGTNSLVFWRHVVAARLYMELGFVHETTSVSAKVDCPNVSGCEKVTESSDRLIQARLGVGTRF